MHIMGNSYEYDYNVLFTSLWLLSLGPKPMQRDVTGVVLHRFPRSLAVAHGVLFRNYGDFEEQSE